MKYGSVCSGIEAASVAWEPLGWEPVFFSEIDPFACAVLEHHYPEVPNLGDMNDYRRWPDADLDVLVGGTPCQSFSVSGLRGGLDDPRGNLTLVFLGLVDRFRPTWVVWENVPGVLSTDEGRPFGAFLGGLEELGYGFAYRILDAQYFGLAQRRKRVFVVAHARDWRRAAAVLLERESLRGHPPPSRESRENPAPTLAARTRAGGGLGTDHDLDGGLIDEGPFLSNPEGSDGATLTRSNLGKTVNNQTPLVVGEPMAFDRAQITHPANRTTRFDKSPAIAASAGAPLCATGEVTHTLKAEGFDASEDGTGRGQPIVFQPRFARNDRGAPAELAGPLTAEAGRTGKGDSAQCVAVNIYPTSGQGAELQASETDLSNSIAPTGNGKATDRGTRILEPTYSVDLYNQKGEEEVSFSLRTATGDGTPKVNDSRSSIRRLTPRECERLQGFPDDFTLIDWSKRASPEKIDDDVQKYLERSGYDGEALKRAALCPDGPRYKALGNSMAVPVVRWIGRRIDFVHRLQEAREEKLGGS